MFDNQDRVQDEVDNLLSDGVLSASEVVGGVFFARDQLLRMKELTISSGTNLIDKGRLQIHEDAARNMLARAGLAEGGVERMISFSAGFVAPCRARFRCSLRRLMCERDDFATP